MPDLNTLLLTTDVPVWVSMEHPDTFEPMVDADGLVAQVALWAPDSDVMRKLEQQLSNDMLDRAARTRGRGVRIDSDLTEKYTRTRFLTRIADWRNLTLGGEPFDCTDATKAQIYDDSRFGLVRRMIDNAAADSTAFLARPTTTTH